MSYTDFALTAAAVRVQRANASHPLAASITVTNSGPAHSGMAIVMAFVQDPVGAAGVGRVVRPWKRLVAFAKERSRKNKGIEPPPEQL